MSHILRALALTCLLMSGFASIAEPAGSAKKPAGLRIPPANDPACRGVFGTRGWGTGRAR